MKKENRLIKILLVISIIISIILIMCLGYLYAKQKVAKSAMIHIDMGYKVIKEGNELSYDDIIKMSQSDINNYSIKIDTEKDIVYLN